MRIELRKIIVLTFLITQQSCIMLDAGLDMVGERGMGREDIEHLYIRRTDTMGFYINTYTNVCEIDTDRNFQYAIEVLRYVPDIKINSFCVTRKKNKDTILLKKMLINKEMKLKNKSDTIGPVIEIFKAKGYRHILGGWIDKNEVYDSLPIIVKSDIDLTKVDASGTRIMFCFGFKYNQYRRFYVHCDIEFGEYYHLKRTFKYRRVFYLDFRPKIW